MSATTQELRRSLGPITLWGLGVGYVISGMYFGWNLGLPQGGTGGLAIATVFITLMYVSFTFSYTELACAIPKAGGAFDYATRALGKDWGFIGGMAQNIEFIFAPPAIAFAIGAYVKLFIEVPSLSLGAYEVPWVAILAYFLFTGLNIYGVEAAAKFELFITVIAVGGLLLFAGTALPAVKVENLTKNAFPQGAGGIFAAIPFAIWFYLAIEGVANVAEETINPQRNVLIGFGSAILTLVILCILTFTSSVGVGGWEPVSTSDAPLPLAIAQVTGDNHWIYSTVIIIGLFGLVASFHGIILAAGRATFEFGRVGYAPASMGKVHPKTQTPAHALLFNMGIGIIALLTGKTGEIITIACFGALALYIISMVALFVLRKNEAELERPFRVPFYPVLPATALIIASVAFAAITLYNLNLALIFFAIMGLSFLGYWLLIRDKINTT